MQQRVPRQCNIAARPGHLKGKHTPEWQAAACWYGPRPAVVRGLQISASQAPKRQAAHWVSVSVRQAAALLWRAGCSAAGVMQLGAAARGDMHLEEWPSALLLQAAQNVACP